MKECSKSILRRLKDSRYATRYFVGEGIDIGGRPDPLALYLELFPRVAGIQTWDIEDGDAQFMSGAPDDKFDFVFSSHCLEHLQDPAEGLGHWFRILKPGGHLIVTVPEEDLYEQGEWPSKHNRDHKVAFTMWKQRSWCSASVNVLDLVCRLGAAADIRKLEVVDEAFRYDLPRYDQTMTPVAECAIELVVRKRTAAELEAGGRLPNGEQPAPEQRGYFNQYRIDQAALKAIDQDAGLFRDEREL